MKKFTRKTKHLYYQSSFTLGASNPSLQTEMLSNSSDVLDRLCYVYTYRNVSISFNYWATLVNSVFAFLLALMTVTGNAFVLAAIWRNPTLRTPSHVLLAGLAFTDFCTGLITLPLTAAYKLAHLRKSSMTCTLVLISFSVGLFFASLTVVVIVMAAAERWLCMSRRSLLTVRRVTILFTIMVCLITAFVTVRAISFRHLSKDIDNLLNGGFLTAAAICILVIAVSYYKVFGIIRHHQKGVQANQNSIVISKYRKSIFTVLYILALFVITYLPYLGNELTSHVLQEFGDMFLTRHNFTTIFVYVSSLLNPLLYCWRMKEIKIGVKNLVKKLLCKQAVEDEEQ